MTGRPPFFNDEKQRLVVELMARGITVTEAAERVGTTRQTVFRTAQAGRKMPANTTKGKFAREFDSIMAGNGPLELTRSDLIKLLEGKAREGSVRAMQLLLQRKDEIDARTKVVPEKPLSMTDELALRRQAS